MKKYFKFIQVYFVPVKSSHLKDELNSNLWIDVKNHFMFLFRKEELQDFLSERNIKVNIL